MCLQSGDANSLLHAEQSKRALELVQFPGTNLPLPNHTVSPTQIPRGVRQNTRPSCSCLRLSLQRMPRRHTKSPSPKVSRPSPSASHYVPPLGFLLSTSVIDADCVPKQRARSSELMPSRLQPRLAPTIDHFAAIQGRHQSQSCTNNSVGVANIPGITLIVLNWNCSIRRRRTQGRERQDSLQIPGPGPSHMRTSC
jgi:hypothetical protein